MTIAAWLFGGGGVLLVGVGAFFVFVRRPLLPEDLRFLTKSADVIDQLVPQLRSWLRRVFVVLGGHALTTGLLTIFVARRVSAMATGRRLSRSCLPVPHR